MAAQPGLWRQGLLVHTCHRLVLQPASTHMLAEWVWTSADATQNPCPKPNQSTTQLWWICAVQRHSEAMETLLTAAAGGKPKPALVFVGATVQDDLAATATQMGWMEQPTTVAIGQVMFAGLPACCSRPFFPSAQYHAQQGLLACLPAAADPFFQVHSAMHSKCNSGVLSSWTINMGTTFRLVCILYTVDLTCWRADV